MITISVCGRIIGGKYCLMEIAGKGGFGEVYRAVDLRLGKERAVKHIVRNCVQAMTEANLMKQFDYPTLPAIIDLIMEEGELYLVMDYLRGKSVGDMLRAHYIFSESELLDIGHRLSETLQHLHSRRPPVLYCDLKPDNVMITEDGQLKLIDFGIASYMENNSLSVEKTAGTRGFAAPEQFGGICDVRTDIYGLGKTLLLMSGGKGSRGFQRFLRKCTRQEKKKRFQNMELALRQLTKIQDNHTQNKSLIRYLLAATVVLMTAGCVFMVWEGVQQQRYAAMLRQLSELPKKTFEETEELCGRSLAWMAGSDEPYLRMLDAGVREGYTQTALDWVFSQMNQYKELPENHKEVLRRAGMLYFCGNALDEHFAVNFEKAAHMFQLAADQDPIWGEIGDMAQRLSGFGKEIDWMQIPDKIKSMEAYADKLAVNGEPEMAISVYRLCGSIYITSAGYLKDIVDKPYSLGILSYEKARELSVKSGVVFTLQQDILECLSVSCYLSGMLEESGALKSQRLPECIRYGEELLEMENTETLRQRVLLREAGCWYRLGNMEETMTCYEAYVRQFPEELQGLCAYIGILLEQREYKRAGELFETAGKLPKAEQDRNYQIIKERMEDIL